MNPFVEMIGFFPNPDDIVRVHTIKEVVVFHYPPTIHIYDVHEYGRRFLRTLTYTSNSSLCLHDVPGDPYPDRVNNMICLSSGSPWTVRAPAPSLVISRRLNAELGVQTFVPSRFLAGIVPACLLEQYRYWQSEDDNLSGEAVDPKNIYSLAIMLNKDGRQDKEGFCCNSDAYALVQRKPNEKAGMKVKTQTLLNVMTARDGSGLKELGLLFSRLDNLSHILFWTNTKHETPADESSIDLVELPRIKMTFRADTVETSPGRFGTHLFSTDHDGLYVTTDPESRKRVENLLGNVPSFIVLQNSDEELFALLPGCALPRRLFSDGHHLSTQMILDRRNQEWIDNLGPVRFYLYPVHPSYAFLYTPSLASSMYLMLLHFIAGNYLEVFKSIESCVSEELTPEEMQIFDQLEFLGNDYHPDAHACRLKFSAVISGFEGAMRIPWSISIELTEYVRKYEAVSSACRLTATEELLLLDSLFESREESASLDPHVRVELENRATFVRGVKKLEAGNVAMADRTLSLKIDGFPKIDNYDSFEDLSILEDSKGSVAGKLFGATYTRPSEEALNAGGVAAWSVLNNILSSGVELASVGKQGFPLLYELLSGILNIRILGDDDPHNFARLLIRLLPSSDTNKKSSAMSALRILAENPHVASAPDLPKFTIDSAMDKFKGMFKGKDATTRLLEQLHAHLTSTKVTIKFPTQTFVEAIPPGSITLPDRNEFFSLSRLWVVPRVTNYDSRRGMIETSLFQKIGVPPPEVQAFLTTPLQTMATTYITKLSRTERGQQLVGSALPFSVPNNKTTETHTSQLTMQRLTSDVQKYASTTNNGTTDTLKGFEPRSVTAFLADKAKLHQARGTIDMLLKALQSSLKTDVMAMHKFIQRALATVAQTHEGQLHSVSEKQFQIGLLCNREATCSVEYLVASSLSSTQSSDINVLNPYLTPGDVSDIVSLTTIAMLTSVRVGQIKRCLALAAKLRNLLATPKVDDKEVITTSEALATMICAGRHYMSQTQTGAASFLPHYLVFEFTQNLQLRKSQVELVDSIAGKLEGGESVVTQLIMGAGKTSVVAPLLALLMASPTCLNLQCMPHALLEMGRNVMREKVRRSKSRSDELRRRVSVASMAGLIFTFNILAFIFGIVPKRL